ncbi:MAG: molybdopterin molybdotransferase MoeA [Gammaproteobacteria bacterium]|nr:molybdopterin molybdotransferase MoeA [Gammaproteobacteria bacterium]MBU1555483.1 molybdopterin molybdotransferase MoeA [Gammaproteobacteria bacterium]MBU2069154.1 molybdopterin molybdotransferase MoeA [Gammaproteobacteria bacterium]MBU2184189.1 molybdopterin molybdotransferase MoeA [Gammaproteobacteria bacterium]MBU2206199.1 molybdopterin molybdotransferase MoeA [Gammaproteobacteria bacterium]
MPDVRVLKPMLSAEQAILQMLGEVAPLTQSVSVPLSDALDRVLAQPVLSNLNVPGYDNAAMDGYALRASDVKPGQPLTVAGLALAGHAFTEQVPAGHCVRITTGAVMPAGLDTVVMQEQVTLTQSDLQQQILCQLVPVSGEHVRRAGEDIAKGAEVFAAGHQLRPADIGLLASIGIANVKVTRQLKVAIFSSGDELVPPGQSLPDGHIYDSNRYVIAAMLKRLGVQVIDLGLLPDDPQAIEQAFLHAMAQADVLITSAGVSVGDADYTRQILHKLGQINFWQVAIKPGKPFAFGKLNNCWFFGLPGNPVAAVVTLEQLVQPVLRKLSGENVVGEVKLLSAECEVPLKKQPGRMDYQRGWYWQGEHGLKVKTLGAQSSGMLSSIANANCYIVLERDSASLPAGEIVSILPFSTLLR